VGANQDGRSGTIDGEIAALDQNGKSSFQLLQSYGKTKQTPLVYYAFDLLFLDGTDLRSRPLTERRKLLANLLKKAPDNIRFSEELRGAGDEVLRVARQFGLEGLIAKSQDSRYESGRRSRSWVKVKLTHQQEFVVGASGPATNSFVNPSFLDCELTNRLRTSFVKPDNDLAQTHTFLRLAHRVSAASLAPSSPIFERRNYYVNMCNYMLSANRR